MPEEESLEATLDNRHRGCKYNMLGQTVPSTDSGNREDTELAVFFPSGSRNCCQYSFRLPTEGWPGWVGLGGLVKYQDGVGPCGARGRCRISPPRFLAESRKRRLNQGSFVSAVCLVVYFLWFVLCLCVYFCDLYWVFFSLLFVCQ